VTPAPHGRALRRGDTGPQVLALQQRLTALGYWLGTPDGRYGELTVQAVQALQKAARIARDGRAGPATLAALDRDVLPAPTSTRGLVVEIDLERQLLLVVRDGKLLVVLSTSTGSGATYWNGGWRLAVTPRGHYRVYAQIDGLRRSPLGLLWRPKYFHGGIAVHGSTSVPHWPASHGCVRLSNAAMDMVWHEALMPIGTQVWVR
jgi:lipoprotein-anchoring transpeptidase ErfK/SrfK